MALKIEHRFWHDRDNRTINFEYSTHLNGQTYVVRECISSLEHRMRGVSLEYVWLNMRRKLMGYIERELFKE